MLKPTGWWLIFVVAGLFAAGGCGTVGPAREPAAAGVGATLERQASAWNAGDLGRFMETYAQAPETRFASGGDISLGWQTVFDRYQKRYGTGAAMGRLAFSDLDITMLSADSAVAFGRYHLDRGGEKSTGLFTLVLRRMPGGWKIVHDHTSAAQ